jgi:hypothetical protein
MNERIRELEAQCWEPKQYGPPWFNSQKFAELIVRECAEVCLDRHHTWRWDNEPDSDSGPRDCARSIKQHFGVEE